MERKKFVVIMAAGSGSRMGASRPKQFLEIGGRMILQRTMEIFLEACPDISVVTVLPEDFISFWREHCLEQNFICPQIIVPGGITRFHSVRNALSRIPDGAIVAVHDGVRPLVSSALVGSMFSMAETVPALVPVIPCIDTLKVLKNDGGELRTVEGAVADRSVLYAAQTPQVFHSEVLKQAYSLPYDTSFTDDASVVQAYGKSLSYTMGERLNIKITTQEDLLLADAVLALKNRD
ncbi:MAG: 2-C-methyl-D-erythritol 4-phosphate cytidylyltransferase [Bacteroidales bacterium]|nr:2-C-methyl-D-erythritol 4-phosphate cytidylyltransferase [Bacteroidales bacterium]